MRTLRLASLALLLSASALLPVSAQRPETRPASRPTGEKPTRPMARSAAPESQPTAQGQLEFLPNSARHRAKGRFDSWRFTKIYNPGGNFVGGVAVVEIDTASVYEETPGLNAHLKRDDMLAVEKYPKAYVIIHDVKASETSPSPVPSATEKAYEGKALVMIKDQEAEFPVHFAVDPDQEFQVEGYVMLDRSKFSHIYQPYDPSSERSPQNEVRVRFNTNLQKEALVDEKPSLEELRASLKTTGEKIGEGMEEAAEGVKEGAQNAVNKVGEGMESLGQNMQEGSRRMRGEGRRGEGRNRNAGQPGTGEGSGTMVTPAPGSPTDGTQN